MPAWGFPWALALREPFALVLGNGEAMSDKRSVVVIGHKNPDTDSICSAICYARLKNLTTDGSYVAKRAGHLNEETQFVLDRFGVGKPEYIKDVRTQIKDIEIREIPGVSSNISLKKAWNMMKEQDLYTLPVTRGEKLEGLITIGDIAKSYMDVYDSNILATAHTSYANIIETLDANLVIESAASCVTEGKVLIAAANPDLMESYIEPNDIVILGNRYESQLCAIEMGAACIIVCEGALVSLTIQKLAQEHGCCVITTPHDTYTVARLINQSMPISYFMRKEGLVTFDTSDYVADIQDIMARKRHRDFPVLDENGNYVGQISRRILMKANKKEVILVDHNEKGQAVFGIDDVRILEIIDHHRLGTIETMTPVFFRNQPLGCTATIVYQMYREQGCEIDRTTAGLLCAAILSDTLMYRSPTCTEVDRQAAEELAQLAGINAEEFAQEMFKAGSNLSSKTNKEICYQDFKKFKINDVTIGIGQINSISDSELVELRGRLLPYMEEVIRDNKLEMVFFMLTDIMAESSDVLYAGGNAGELVSEAFAAARQEDGNYVRLDGVVSRKKQFLPTLMEAMQQ